ncbi:hypothetical protein [Curtobacterium sp. ISL-83]|uniref:hypothetical protein n=1 Tax=Curtobacterium sp. ISL-83 TaxID=2819145 RepID=UPI001BECBED5|nr:hypothetical protein [Curtobacterium sp. ISL-83]MBT2504016.1 hypothetical protein [Curtobacterium sp. ISL-83]
MTRHEQGSGMLPGSTRNHREQRVPSAFGDPACRDGLIAGAAVARRPTGPSDGPHLRGLALVMTVGV